MLVRWFGSAVLMIASCASPAAPPSAAASGAAPEGKDEAELPPEPEAPTLTVMTYNVNFGEHRRQETVQAIRDAGADVVFLQETTPSWERLLVRELREVYPHIEFRHERRAGGLAVLSRHPYQTREFLPSPVGRFPAWLVVVDTPLGALQVMNLHLLPIMRGEGNIVARYYSTQKVRLRETLAYLERLDPSLPTLLAGDFNEDLAGRSVSLLRERGFESATEPFHPGVPTWRWDTAMGEVRWQLDHILHSRDLVSTWAHIVEAGGSDHLPVIARLQRAR